MLIAGLNEEHRTEIALDNVFITGIKPRQVHLAFADISSVAPGTNLPLNG